jgi:hypothetical protein
MQAMAKYAESDPRDHAVWQANHDDWASLINAETEHRAGRTPPDWYRELLEAIDKYERRLATGGSSTSTLSDTQAFEQGYLGGR